MNSTINIHGMINVSRANGPGTRCVIWVQGCSLRCAGCFNPDTHSFKKILLFEVLELSRSLAMLFGDGLTVSGGEPLDQAEAVHELISWYKKFCDKTVILFTGYTIPEILSSPMKYKVALLADAVVSGRYAAGPQWKEKRLILPTGKIRANEICPSGDIEFFISGKSALITGYPAIKNINHEISLNPQCEEFSI